ncbi:protein VARIATION IN COMPOUND TRIGGERED ROOT growth response [Medicago truncatula]|uniref:protein VARIATION IN COMPOUND TRIGGERED ROOT growth response n=1 Tax=Medicago truncatula TaxID=3880 RepID=UPI000D2F19C2|nr:protein VARIATION IN COMPOUND TRIGGERED ROOT growth response [Medicago truncatula]
MELSVSSETTASHGYKLSWPESSHPDELDEEFDTFPTSRSHDAVRMRSKSEDINNIVQGLIRLIEDKFVSVAKHPVGVEARMQDVIQLLNAEQPENTIIIGVWGTNGVGKTTIAKAT